MDSFLSHSHEAARFKVIVVTVSTVHMAVLGDADLDLIYANWMRFDGC
jgi:hypothetical protein